MCSLFGPESYNDINDVPNTSTVNWQLWCRLCAKEDPEGNIRILLKDEQLQGRTVERTRAMEDGDCNANLDLVSFVEKYFWIQIACDDKLPKMLCTECFSLVTSLVNFSERVVKVQQMFLTLNNSYNAMDVHSVRLKYGLFDDDRQHVLIHQPSPEIHYFETTLTTANYNKTDADECEEALLVNPLEDSTLGTKIKKENILNVLTYDYNDEFISNNKVSGINNVEECFVDDLPMHTNEASERSDSVQLNDDNNKKFKRQLRRKGNNKRSDSVQLVDGIKKASKRKLPNSKSNNCDDKEEPENCRQRKRERQVPSTSVADAHVPTESDNEAVACTDCPRKFKRMQDLRWHMSRLHSKKLPPQALPCPQCSRIFTSKYNFQRHLTTHFPDEERKIFPCSQCVKKFSTKSLMQIHIKHVHMDERPYICEECGIAVRTNGTLKEHMLTHTDYMPFKCEVCEKHFKDKYRLKNHMDIHNPNKHICAKCGLQLNSRVTLNRHLLVHSDVMRHKCDYCGRAFKRAKTLKTHLLLHIGLKPYSCNFCDRTFANGANCRSHKKTAHPVELAALEATGGGKTHTQNIPKLEALKAITRVASNLAPIHGSPVSDTSAVF